MPLSIEWICDLGSFVALAPQWEGLLPADARPFDMHCWLRAWWVAFGGTAEMQVCTAWRGERLVGAFPLRRDARRLLGFTNGHSPLCRPLAVDEEAMAAVAKAVSEKAGAGLELEGLPEGDPGLRALLAAGGEAGLVALTEPVYAMPYVDTSGDYETWRKENKHRWKAPLERKWRKMERDYEAKFVLAAAPADLGAELEEGLRIEASGWKGEEGTAIESSPDSATFYREIATALQERDELRFSWIYLDGKAVSFDYCILHRNRLYTLKSGYDEEYKGLAPGFVLRLAVIKDCFENGVATHELLGDETGWKPRFSSGNRPHVNLRAYSRGPVGLVRYAYRTRLRPSLKRAYRQVRPVRR